MRVKRPATWTHSDKPTQDLNLIIQIGLQHANLYQVIWWRNEEAWAQKF